MINKEIKNIYEYAKKNNVLMNVTIELLTNCNWKCKHCYIPKHNNNGLKKEELFSLFEELRGLGCFEITFTGGEMFLREDIMDILKKAREMFFNVILFTNVSLLNEEKIKKLSDIGVFQISCTIFSLNEDIHDEITGIKGSLKETLKNIKLIKKYRIPLEVKTILMKTNKFEYKQIQSFCDKNDFGFKTDLNVFSKIDGNKNPISLRLEDKEIKSVIKKTDKIIGYKKRENYNSNDYACPSLKNSIYIDKGGNVYPCNKLLIKIGNIKKDKIVEIWNNSEVLKKIQEIKWKDLSECNVCKTNEYCVRCPEIFFNKSYNNLFLKSENSCYFSNLRKDIY